MPKETYLEIIKIIKELTIFLPFQITGMVPKITALQEALPKSIGLLSFDGGLAGNVSWWQSWFYIPL